MKIRTVKYFLVEGIKGTWTNRLMMFAALGVVVACLTIFGMFILFSMNLNYIGAQVQEQCEIQVFLNEDITQDKIDKVGAELKKDTRIKESTLETKEQALENFRKQLAENADILDGLEKNNPLRNSYRIKLNDLRDADQVMQGLQKIDGIDKINNRKDIMDRLIRITDLVKTVSFWIMILLAVIAVFIISNTIKLAVFARRKEINIMKFVGATDWFIRWPFIIEGIIIGLIGSLLSFALIGYGYDYVLSTLSNKMDIFNLKKFAEVCEQLIITFIIFGVFIGAAGSGISIRKYLHV